MNKKNQLAVINSFIRDIRYNMPKKAEELDKRTIKTIYNAVGAGVVDTKGVIWFDCSKLHTILRVRTKNDAAYILEQVDNKYKANYSNSTYIRWSSLVGLIAKRVEGNPNNEYLKVVLNILYEINNSNDVKVLQGDAKLLQEKNIKKLKWQRIRTFKIVKDELTNERLDEKKAEFSHIRSITMFPEFSECIWNGLIVNKKTHKIITNKCINDEDELYALCYENGWNVKWYDQYKEKIIDS